jgi:predicted dehydrogenase
LRHVPGLRALQDVELVAVCNRRLESTAASAREFGIPRTYLHWQELVESPEIDAVVIGAWPNLHCPVTLAALELGKHVLTEARMSMNAAEARQMLAASQRHPKLVTQVVPSPYGLHGHAVVKELLESGYIGQPREMHVYGMTSALADPATPLSWRQDAALSGYNMLTLGILHETVSRWVTPVVRVVAQVHAFIGTRIDPQSGVRRPVGTPDSVQVLTVHEDGMRGLYQFSGVTPLSPGLGVRLYGSEGALFYDMTNEKLFGARLSTSPAYKGGAFSSPPYEGGVGGVTELSEIPIPADRALGWRVEADFVDAIREGTPIQFTDFPSGVAYMEFTEAVARSAQSGAPVELPLEPQT